MVAAASRAERVKKNTKAERAAPGRSSSLLTQPPVLFSRRTWRSSACGDCRPREFFTPRSVSRRFCTPRPSRSLAHLFFPRCARARPPARESAVAFFGKNASASRRPVSRGPSGASSPLSPTSRAPVFFFVSGPARDALAISLRNGQRRGGPAVPSRARTRRGALKRARIHKWSPRRRLRFVAKITSARSCQIARVRLSTAPNAFRESACTACLRSRVRATPTAALNSAS